MRRKANGDWESCRCVYLSGWWFQPKASRQSPVLQIWLSPLFQPSPITPTTVLQGTHEEFCSKIQHKKYWLHLMLESRDYPSLTSYNRRLSNVSRSLSSSSSSSNPVSRTVLSSCLFTRMPDVPLIPGT